MMSEFFILILGYPRRHYFCQGRKRSLYELLRILLTLDRQIFYARYVDWSVTTPLLLLDLCLLAGTPGIDIIALIFADLGMILTGLFASLENSTKYSWGWYAIANFFYLYIIYGLVFNGRTSASVRGQKVAKLYDSVAGFTLILWTCGCARRS